MDQKELLTLNDAASYPAISIYFPTIALGTDRQQNPIRYKNALKRVEDELHERDLYGAEIKEQFSVAHELLKDEDFWGQMKQGLAIFISRDHFSHLKLPFEVEKKELVSTKFLMTPLLAWLDRHDEFFLLSLSQENVSLYHGTPRELDPVEVPEMPTSFTDFMKDTLFEKNSQTITDRHSVAQGDLSSHGYFDKEAQHKKNLKEMYHAVSKAVQDALINSSTPLILAGVEYEIPMFRETCKYAHILEQDISQNIANLHSDQILEKVRELVKPLFDEKIQADLSTIQELRAIKPEIIALTLEDIIAAATQGRVDRLFIESSRKQLGTYDATNMRVKTDEDQKEAHDLYSYSALQVLNNGGTVHVLQDDTLPADVEGAVAILRY